MNNKEQKTEWRGLEIELAAWDRNIQEAFIYPNSWLPNELHDNVRGGRTPKRVAEILDQTADDMTEHQRKKAIKARNIEILAQQVNGNDIDKPFNYNNCEKDEIALYKNEQALIMGMCNGGFLDADDFVAWEFDNE